MTTYPIMPLVTGLLSFCLCWTFPQPTALAATKLAATNPEGQITTSEGQAQSLQTVLQTLTKAHVVYLGETHDRPADHHLQLSILQALHQRRSRLVLALEMFQRPYQAVLDRYSAGDIGLTELRHLSQYDQRWGFPWDGYAPILDFAQTHQMPLVALNTPTEVTRKIARGGWDALTSDDRQWIPAPTEVRLEPEAYRQQLRQVYEEIHSGQTHSMGFENFFLAQVLWDETMADRIATLHQQHPDALIVVLVGQGHIRQGYGIPSRVARRTAQALGQVTVLLNPDAATLKPTTPAIADYFWFTVAPSPGTK